MSETVLKVEDLQTWYPTPDGTLKAVDGVTLRLRRGKVLGLVGESGSGKTVTALSILRLVRPPGTIVGGRILFHGKDLLSLPPARMRTYRGSSIAMVFQDPSTALNPYLTIGRQVSEMLEVHRRLSSADAWRQGVDLLRRVGVPDAPSRAHQLPHQLSEGTRQRVLLAMAMSCKPEVLLADEPTTGLDVTRKAQILALIKELTAQSGLSVLLITHDMGVLAGIADEVSVLYAGRILEHAPVRDLFHSPRHPYTRGLLASVPRLRRHRLPDPIPGSPPDLLRLEPGCPFAPRCGWREERCAVSPPSRTVGEDHTVACWKAEAEGTTP